MLFSSVASAAGNKRLKTIKNEKKVNLDVNQFGKYLHDGEPDSLEGIYKSRDGRYLIALVKNDENGHDFLGVVVSADNPYWEEGQVKFNFVRNSDNQLKGYIYNSQGVGFPISFDIGKSTIKCRLLKKVKLKDIPNGSLASL
jgi:hypothetical protein